MEADEIAFATFSLCLLYIDLHECLGVLLLWIDKVESAVILAARKSRM